MCGIDLKNASDEDLSKPANIEFIKIKTAIPNVTPKAATMVKRLLLTIYVYATSVFIGYFFIDIIF